MGPGLYHRAGWIPTSLPFPAVPRPGKVRRDWRLVAAVAGLAFAFTLIVASANGHSVHGVRETAAIRIMIALVPVVAAAFVALAIFRPWPAFLGILILTPVWDSAQVSWYILGTQILLQTVFAVALLLGCLLSGRRRTAELAQPETEVAVPAGIGRRIIAALTAGRIAAAALVVFLILAFASTFRSVDVDQSGIVLLHGLLEPIAMGLVLVALRPNRIDLALAAIALGVSAAVGCLINIVQFVPGATSLAALQTNRFDFSLLTYSNVGLLGEILSMSVPLLLGTLLARRSLRLSAVTVALLVVALGVSGIGLFLTFSKSAWLATSLVSVLLLLLAARGWKSRTAIVLTAGLVSTVVVPWPALALQGVPQLNDAYRNVMVRIMGESRFDSWNPATVAGQGSVAFRVRAAESGYYMAKDHPWLGVGLMQYHYYYVRGYAVRPINTPIDHAHSLWPELAAELGFPAMFMVAVIYLAALLSLWRVYRNPPDSGTRLLAAAFAAALIGWIIVATAFGTDIYRPVRNMSSELIMMGVVTAAAFALARYARAARQRLDAAVAR